MLCVCVHMDIAERFSRASAGCESSQKTHAADMMNRMSPVGGFARFLIVWVCGCVCVCVCFCLLCFCFCFCFCVYGLGEYAVGECVDIDIRMHVQVRVRYSPATLYTQLMASDSSANLQKKSAILYMQTPGKDSKCMRSRISAQHILHTPSMSHVGMLLECKSCAQRILKP